MKTTLDIPLELLEEAMRLTGTRTKREVVLRALSELNRREKMAALAGTLGGSETFMGAEELAALRARGDAGVVILVDTSSLVHFLRRTGDPAVKERVRGILRRGDAATCDLIRVELWMGVGSEQDERDVIALTAVLPTLPTDARIWNLARDLAARCRRAGQLVPTSDVVIAACAFGHGAAVDAEDAHFAWLERFRE